MTEFDWVGMSMGKKGFHLSRRTSTDYRRWQTWVFIFYNLAFCPYGGKIEKHKIRTVW